MRESPPSAKLVLEDGTIYLGRSVGAPGERCFELVFQTAMSGYQEILTDPSYCGQGVVMTYPQIGNYGVHPDDEESHRCWPEAFFMRQLSPVASSWRARQSLGAYLKEREVLAMDGLDTRHLTLKLRRQGALRAIFSTEDMDEGRLQAKLQQHPSLSGQDLAQKVSCRQGYAWSQGLDPEFPVQDLPVHNGPPLDLVCLDFGIKRNILRCLVQTGFRPWVVPADTPAEAILERKPDGVFLSNGPGDPAAVEYAHNSVRNLCEAGLPVLGICFGHQILAHAFGGATEKMKFGHHGANHPVIELETGRIDITSQNHSFAVQAESLKGTGLSVTHLNGNDGSVEGLRHQELPVQSVQYHPEAAPGPHDAAHLFARFRQRIRPQS
ncbi:MAG: carbamoyl-phosphate synthase small subunit [Planctomycetota bacterium]|nr:MAG: carbamoyl-phosphate synthase small subunit [Planctomycetota bacterium]